MVPRAIICGVFYSHHSGVSSTYMVKGLTSIVFGHFLVFFLSPFVSCSSSEFSTHLFYHYYLSGSGRFDNK